MGGGGSRRLLPFFDPPPPNPDSPKLKDFVFFSGFGVFGPVSESLLSFLRAQSDMLLRKLRVDDFLVSGGVGFVMVAGGRLKSGRGRRIHKGAGRNPAGRRKAIVGHAGFDGQ